MIFQLVAHVERGYYGEAMKPTPITDTDRDEVADFIVKHWGSMKVMSCGKAYFPHELEGLIQRTDGKIVGLLTMREDDGGLEVLTLNSTLEGRRIGSSMMLSAIDVARDRGLKRIWLTTTNDNLRAIGFYQRLGFRLTEIHPGAVDEARKIKPEIPEVGRDGIPIHDELVLELPVKPYED